MSIKAIVLANHKTKKATLNFIDEENNLVMVDHNNEELIGMSFPYSNIEDYGYMFESFGKINDDVEKYHFKKTIS